MLISFRCDFCRKEFRKDESLAGKKGRCSQCGHVFIIPAASHSPVTESGRPSAPERAVAERRPASSTEKRHVAPSRDTRAATPRTAAAQAPLPPRYAPPPMDDDPYGLHDLPPRMPVAAAADADDLVVPRRAGMSLATPGTRRKRRRREEAELFSGLPDVTYLLAPALMGVTYVLALTGLVPRPTGGLIFLGTAGLSALLFLIYGGIGLIVGGFRGGLLNGLLCWFCPFYIFGYVAKEWDMMKGAFLSYVAGIGVVIATAVLLPSLAPANPSGGDESVAPRSPTWTADEPSTPRPSAGTGFPPGVRGGYQPSRPGGFPGFPGASHRPASSKSGAGF
ncbi:hypothetical protein OJF2_57730 [Aquisphaera giovannonii]|uniref:Zinc finger/thioredoxin putative domain-containing protein n=1 Tax=Aquisphaera giovannonii TaxID=406548 RepID=A0A5B9W9I4_9BACT|nr:hypothetical protein [Aquisphaera giovannonii]QEH37186.1 hypothetical protein OJF2_57730 [Aquisphaera giovannonii]